MEVRALVSAFGGTLVVPLSELVMGVGVGARLGATC